MGLAWASPRLVGASSRTETLARSSKTGLRLASCDDPDEKGSEFVVGIQGYGGKNRSDMLWFETRCTNWRELSELKVS